MKYRLTDREFSRAWRRNKIYSEKDLRWLAKRRGLSVVIDGPALQVVDARLNKIVANFAAIPDTLEHDRHDAQRIQAYAALKVKIF